MKMKDLKPNPRNPRKISKEKKSALKKAMDKFGDLGGIVFNIKTNQLVGGHQRTTLLENSIVVVTESYKKPTKTGTVSEGYIENNQGERFAYREVSWDEKTEKAANIAANKNAGVWDFDILGGLMKEIAPADLDLTMFDIAEIAQLPGPKTLVSSHTRAKTDGLESKEKLGGPAICKAGQIYNLGKTQLKCGADDLAYCDLIISRWESYSKKKAVLQKTITVKK